MKIYLLLCLYLSVENLYTQIQSGQVFWLKSISTTGSAVFNNASFLSDNSKFLVGTVAGHRYGVSNLYEALLYTQFPLYKNSGGLYYYTQMFPAYTQTQIGLCYGIKINSKTAFGLRFKRTKGRIIGGDDAFKTYYTADLCYHTKYGEKTIIATYLENIGSDLFQKRPSGTVWNLGLKYALSKQVALTMEMSKPITESAIVRYHITYYMTREFLLEFGGAVNPAQYFFALKYQTGRFGLGVQMRTHPILGNSYFSSLSYALK